jgi:cell division topological specificity factor
MNLLRLFKPISSAPVARRRLQLLLEYERRREGRTNLIAVLREEVFAVVGRYVTVDPNKVTVKELRGATALTVAVDIAIPNRDYADAIARYVSGGQGRSLPMYQ